MKNIEQCFELFGEEPDDSPNPVIAAMEKEGEAMLKKTDDEKHALEVARSTMEKISGEGIAVSAGA